MGWEPAGRPVGSAREVGVGNYQEMRIRQCERSTDRYMAMPPFQVDWRTQQKCGRHG
jgi:hypothetical protein